MERQNIDDRISKQTYRIKPTFWNRTTLLPLLLVTAVFSIMGVWGYRFSPAPAAVLAFLLASFTLVAATVASTMRKLLRHLEHKRLMIVLLDQQLLKMSRLAATSKLSLEFLSRIQDGLVNIDSAATWCRSLIGQNHPDGLKESLDQIKSESVRHSVSLNKLLMFARPTEDRWVIQDIDINQLVLDSLELYAIEFDGRHIQVNRSLQTDLGPVRSNFSRLCQAIQNLLLVIISDMAPEGRLEILTADTGEGVRIDVHYPSRGFDQKVLRRLADPAYALQLQDPGPWLALCVYHVDRINGRLSAEKTASGLKFRITLPYHMGAAPMPPARAFLKGL